MRPCEAASRSGNVARQRLVRGGAGASWQGGAVRGMVALCAGRVAGSGKRPLPNIGAGIGRALRGSIAVVLVPVGSWKGSNEGNEAFVYHR